MVSAPIIAWGRHHLDTKTHALVDTGSKGSCVTACNGRWSIEDDHSWRPSDGDGMPNGDLDERYCRACADVIFARVSDAPAVAIDFDFANQIATVITERGEVRYLDDGSVEMRPAEAITDYGRVDFSVPYGGIDLSELTNAGECRACELQRAGKTIGCLRHDPGGFDISDLGGEG